MATAKVVPRGAAITGVVTSAVTARTISGHGGTGGGGGSSSTAGASAASAVPGSLHVLVVEDNPMNQVRVCGWCSVA